VLPLAGRKTTCSGRVFEVGFDLTGDFHGERVPSAVACLAGHDANPPFADAVLFDIGFFRPIEANTDVAFENFLVVIRALWIGTEPVG
jgi:hypothetical protein